MAHKLAEQFSSVSDEKLAALAAGDKSALTALIIRFNSTVSALAAKLGASGGDFDDFLQEGVMGLLDAVKAYSPSGGASFRTFAAVCIRNRMLGLKTGDNPSVSLEDNMLCEGSEESPESIVVREEQERLLFKSVSQMLTATEWNVLKLYLRGLSYADIADRLGISGKSVDNAMQRARRKLKKSILEI